MKRSNYNHLLETEYPAVRRVMQEDLQQLDDDALEELLSEWFPATEPDDVENFMRTLQKFGRQAAPIAQKALPGIVQGAMTGATVAGPYGAIAGAIGGGAASLLSSPQPTTPASTPSATPTPQKPSPAPVPVAPPPAASPAASPPQAAPGQAALAQLVFLLSRPETMRALSSLLLPGAGRQTQQVGNQQVPALAFANAISELAGELAEAYAVPEEDGVSNYLLDEYGEARGDIFNPAERAALLIADLASISAVEAEIEAAEEMEMYEIEAYEHADFIDDKWIDSYDPLDIYESALQTGDFYDN